MQKERTVKLNGNRSVPRPEHRFCSGTVNPSHYRPFIFQEITPLIDAGAGFIKWEAGRALAVSCNIFRDGHDMAGAAIRYRCKGDEAWHESPMYFSKDDKWEGAWTPTENARYEYEIQAWTDPVATWINNIEKKATRFLRIKTELQEGLQLLGELESLLPKTLSGGLSGWILKLQDTKGESDKIIKIIRSEDFLKLSGARALKKEPSSSMRMELMTDRKKAVCGAWYELFPRSQGKAPGRHGTFRDCIARLGDISAMGFDVIYLPPIHPIGTTHRKGPNNSLIAPPGACGSPWAIGSEEGGHKSVHPELGTMKDFEAFVAAAAEEGIEIALDFAAQCSPDHPYAKDHPEWFYHLPDGTIRCAENPPKKYEDIYPFNFLCEEREALWREMLSIVLFWIQKGVKIFRVDNPHTKPLRFWAWLIREVQEKYPDVIFLAEAFTRPRVMKYLAKIGFTQSYTYFTWRNYKWELKEYLEELNHSDTKYYFRPNFFVNTPDILHETLQKGGPPSFRLRLVLAATLSASYGIYSGYELCENTPLREGSEEYMNSEKYEIRVRNWKRSGNINDLISRMNLIRRFNPALQQNHRIEFYQSYNDNILIYGKWNEDRTNVIVTAVNLNPNHAQEDMFIFPYWNFGIQYWQSYQMRDLLSGDKYLWRGERQYVRLDPAVRPAHVFLLKK